MNLLKDRLKGLSKCQRYPTEHNKKSERISPTNIFKKSLRNLNEIEQSHLNQEESEPLSSNSMIKYVLGVAHLLYFSKVNTFRLTD